MRGSGADFLRFSLEKIANQTFKDFEVVISDHSKDDSIFSVCEQMEEILNIKYIKNDKNRGCSSSNINNSILNCEGEWIKILFQDDFLLHVDSLKIIKENIGENTKWIATGCDHTNNGVDLYRPFLPKWNNKIKDGINTISSPSVISFKNHTDEFFDKDFIWLMDVEWYYRMYLKYGEPFYVNDINVVNRVWDNSLSNNISHREKTEEIKKIKLKYG